MKRALTLFSFLAFAVSAQASYLMWQVDAGDVGDFNASAVRIAYSTDGGSTAAGYLTLQTVDPSDSESWKSLGEIVNLDGSKSVPQLYASVDNLTGPSYSYFIELLNYDAASTPQYKTVAVSEASTYATLTEKGFTDTSLNPTIPTTVWHGGTYSVPEPTSAMLVMMGFGLLALKRKKA